jgi:hypothetical protein
MPKNQSLIRPDFPNPHRLAGALLFREALGDMGHSTFARHLKLGLIPAPDKKVRPLNMWFETTVAATIAALPTERPSKLQPRRHLPNDEHVVSA